MNNIQIINFQSKDAPNDFTQSLKNTGFAVIKNHPVDMNLVNKVYKIFRIKYSYNYIRIS